MITEQREQELAEAFGLSKVPENRYDDIPKPNKPTSMAGLISFKKSLMLVDRLNTAAFHHYLDDRMVIDQSMDAGFWSPEQSWGVSVRTDVPPPVNERITNAIKIKPTTDKPNYFIWLNNKLYETYLLVGALAMAPPLVWLCGNKRWLKDPKLRAAGAVPLMGVCAKFKLGGSKANLGVLVPAHQKQYIDPEHRILAGAPLSTESIEDQIRRLKEEIDEEERDS